MSLANDIHEALARSGKTWRFIIDGEAKPVTPSVEDIEGMLTYLSDKLDEDDASQTIEFPLTGGRILMKINDNTKDVYVHFGEMENDE